MEFREKKVIAEDLKGEVERLQQEIDALRSENIRLKELHGDSSEENLYLKKDVHGNRVYRLLVEMANSLIIWWDTHGKIKFVNEYTLQYFGYTREEMIGNSVMLIVPEKELSGRDLTNIAYDIVSSPDDFITNENENIRKNGEHVWISWTNKAVTDENGNVREVIAIGNDITKLKSAEEALQKQNIELIAAKERAEESDRLKSAFLANLRHEIRTPMNGIIGFTDLLKTQDLSAETQNMYLDAIKASGRRMLDIIDALINISRIETGELELNHEFVSVHDLLDEIFICFRTEAEKKGIALRMKYEIPDQLEIRTDRIKLSQVLTHLVKNAIRFTSEGFVECGCRLNDNCCLFYVEDSGIGIRAEYREQIFKHFRHGDINNESQEGIGLGLAISKAYVELLGGELKLESEFGRGSRFSFTIPVDEKHIKKEPLAHSADLSGMKKTPTVLIAEDDELIYFFIEEVLRLNNIKTYHANDGIDAVEAIKSYPDIDLVLMDTRMSRMNGLEATRLIKMIRPDIPVIAQSAFVSEEDTQRALEAGCVDFIPKPIDKNILLKKIARYTG